MVSLVVPNHGMVVTFLGYNIHNLEKVIRCIYGEHGGLDVSISSHNRTNVWERINKINIDMEKSNIDLINLFYRIVDMMSKSISNNWSWTSMGDEISQSLL